MNIKIGAFMACTLVVGSFSAFAQAPVPYNVRAGHNIIYMDWSANALREGANKRGNSSRLTQSFHFFMFEPIFSPVNALNQPI
ncbi:hypothetical protein [Aeromonas caviae]|uniref:hypothetical protein n=1 Tax=Aeromonas caviae TaxID=648 RepID=UPI00244D5020|nr:hypothetical protein [Aeromonas caviae]MDH1496133.1 hypothetical protein [Aeromonas caviae]